MMFSQIPRFFVESEVLARSQVIPESFYQSEGHHLPKAALVICIIEIQGVSKKRYFSDFLSYFSSRGRILPFHMCFGIRFSSLFHQAIQKVSIQNLNCPKNAFADTIFIPALQSEETGSKF